MQPDGDPAAEAVGDGGPVPAADLLFGIAALMIAVLVMLLQGLSASVRPSVAPIVAALIDANDPALLLLAEAAGVGVVDRTGPVPRRGFVATGHLLADTALPPLLAAARQGTRPVLVVIADDAGEASFVLEGLLARHGPGRVLQARLDGPAAGAFGAGP